MTGSNGHSGVNGANGLNGSNGHNGKKNGKSDAKPKLGAFGRPIIEGNYTWSADEWLEAYRHTGSALKASQTVGINMRTAYTRRHRDAKFDKAWDEVRREQNQQLQDTMLQRALNGVVEEDVRCVSEETVTEGGVSRTKRTFAKVSQRVRYPEATAIFLSKARMPHIYSDKGIEIRALQGEEDGIHIDAKFNIRKLSAEGREHLRALLEEQRAIERGVVVPIDGEA